MAKRPTQETPSPGELLKQLKKIEPEQKKQSDERLKETPLETQLLALADISIEKETEALRNLFSRLRKLSHK